MKVSIKSKTSAHPYNVSMGYSANSFTLHFPESRAMGILVAKNYDHLFLTRPLCKV